MRIACISHGSIVALNRRPYDLLAERHGLDVTVIVPDRWLGDLPDPDLRFRGSNGAAPVIPLPARATGNGSRFWLRGLRRCLAELRPGLVLLDEEPWSLVAWQTLRARVQAPLLFYSKQNIAKRLPPPFSAIRRATYRRADQAWAVGKTTGEVLRGTGFTRPIHVVPHGVEIARFTPGRDEERRRAIGLSGVVIGFAGRLVAEKGVVDLLDAARLLTSRWPTLEFTLLFAGAGPLRGDIDRAAAAGPLAGRIRAIGGVPHDEAPGFYRLMDILALPSRTTRRWREQFGRALIEAAATALPIVAAASGEIPHVLAALGGGIVVPEKDPAALAGALRDLLADAARRDELGRSNLLAAQAHYSQEAVADRMRRLLSDVEVAPDRRGPG